MSQIRRMGYLLVALFAVAIVFSRIWKPTPLIPFTGIPSADIPKNVGGFVSPGDYKMDPTVTALLATGDVIARDYSDGTNTEDFVLIGGTDRAALHDPRSCLVGAGWTLEDQHSEVLPGTNISVRTCHAIGLPGAPSYDIMYLYVINGHVINQPTQVRLSMALSSLIGVQNNPVYFLRFMTQDPTQGSVDPATHAAMERFAASMWNAISGRLATG